MHRRVRDTDSPGQLRLWFQAGTHDEKEDRDNNGIIDAIQDTTELLDELERKGFRRGLDMIYTQVEGGEHNQQTWGFILPYFLRWTFPTSVYAQQHPRDGMGLLSVPMQGKPSIHQATKRRRSDVQAKRVLRVAGVRSKIVRRNKGR
jgi:hypothetical protein